MPNLFQESILSEDFTSGKLDLHNLQWLTDWLVINGIHYSEPRVRKVVAGLKDSGVTRLAIAGYCYGARSALNLAFENLVDVVVATHPSFVKVPEDFEVGDLGSYRYSRISQENSQTYLEKSKAPILFNCCEIDPLFDATARTAANKILGDGKFAPGYQQNYWEGVAHGFATRGDLVCPSPFF